MVCIDEFIRHTAIFDDQTTTRDKLPVFLKNESADPTRPITPDSTCPQNDVSNHTEWPFAGHKLPGKRGQPAVMPIKIIQIYSMSTFSPHAG
jgi:hypothetical protein